MPINLATLALSACSSYAASASLVWLAQGRIIFGKPRRMRQLLQGPLPLQHTVQSLRLAVSDTVQLEGWSARPAPTDKRRVLIYFGGRNEHVAWVCAMPSYLGAWTVYAFNYRGFGQSGGRASESSAKADALKIYEEVRRLEAGPDTEIAIVGRSLGTAIASAVAARKEVRHLVLLSPFESLEQLLRKRPLLNAMRWTLRQKFDCTEDARRVRARTAVLLAARDTRIPHPSSRALAARLQAPATLCIVPGTTHQSLPRHPATQAAIAAFLNPP